MLQEFMHDHKVYAVRNKVDFGSPFNEEVVLFRNLDRAQEFFRSAAQDPFARKDLLKVADRLKPTYCRPKKICPKSTDQEQIEQLCLRVFQGDLILVEIKPKPAVWLEDCCIKSKDAIGAILKNAKVLDKALLAGKILTIFVSNSRGSNLASIASTAVATHGIDISNINSKEWEILARAIMAVPIVARRKAFDIAGDERRKHELDNKRELEIFWKGVCDAFA